MATKYTLSTREDRLSTAALTIEHLSPRWTTPKPGSTIVSLMSFLGEHVRVYDEFIM